MRRVLVLVVALLLVGAACSSDSDTATTATQSDAAVDDQAATADEVGSDVDEDTDQPGSVYGSYGNQNGDGAVTSNEVTFATADGETLEGTLFVGDDAGAGTAVVLGHMRGTGKETWFELAEQLAAAGYPALAYDSRGYGSSTGERDQQLDVDQAAAVDFLVDEGAIQVVVMGASMNATASIVSAADLDLAGVVSLSAPGQFMDLDASTSAAGIDEPALIVAAEDDSPYVDVAPALAADSGGELVIYDGSSHGTRLFDDHGDELSALLLDFVASVS